MNKFGAIFTVSVGITLAYSVVAAPGQQAPGKGPNTNTTTNQDLEVPKSVFVVPASPDQGRNPFFPRSVPTPVVQVVKQARPQPTTIDTSALVLNGLTSPPKATAMINGRTFEQGEEGEVKLPGGQKLLVKVLEIREDAAIVEVNGVARRELRLRLGV